MKISGFSGVAAITIVFTPVAAQAKDCFKVQLSPAESCRDLKASVDVSACGDSVVGSPVFRCAANRNEIHVQGEKFRYILKLKKGGGAWGNSGWELASARKIPVVKQTLAHAQSQAADPASHKGHVPGSETASAPTVQAPAVAQPQATSTPSASPALSASGLQFSAYFDVYYAHNLNRPQPLTAPNAPQNNLHFYDWYQNQLGLNLVELTVKHQRKETAFLADFDFGQMADINAQVPVAASSGGPTPALVDEVSKHIGQAVFSYTPEAVPGLVIEAGKMYTHVGLELVKPKDNWNYSRSALFSFGGPFWHTGFHVGYAVVPNKVSASVYLYQGWNTIYENNAGATLGAQLKWTPMDNFTWIYNYIGGPEQALNNNNRKQVHETNVTFAPATSLAFAADFLTGKEQGAVAAGTSDASWTGLEVLAKWQVTPLYSLSPRFEVYRDGQGYTLGGDSQTLTTYTLTQALQVSEGFETRLEFKYDKSTSDTRFITKDGTASSQPALILGVLYTM